MRLQTLGIIGLSTFISRVTVQKKMKNSCFSDGFFELGWKHFEWPLYINFCFQKQKAYFQKQSKTEKLKDIYRYILFTDTIAFSEIYSKTHKK